MSLVGLVYSPSVLRPSFRPSVTLMYRGRIRWITSKVIALISSLGSSLLGPQHRQRGSTGTSLKFGWNKSGVVVLNGKLSRDLQFYYILYCGMFVASAISRSHISKRDHKLSSICTYNNTAAKLNNVIGARVFSLWLCSVSWRPVPVQLGPLYSSILGLRRF